MIIGIPKEIKPNEYRVASDPNGVQELTSRGSKVLVQKGAGAGSGFSDEDYALSGAVIVDSAEDIFKEAELIYKVKEIFPEEFVYYERRTDNIYLYTF